jgi:endonuclease YncB( thermonuclease family)
MNRKRQRAEPLSNSPKSQVKGIFLLVFLLFFLFAINYTFVNNAVIKFLEERETGIVERVIDGDTLVVNKSSVRLLGINTPEKGEPYFDEAKSFLEIVALNKTIELEKTEEDKDKYNRLLRYIFLDNKNINAELVRNGFANLYIYNNDKYTSELRRAWSECLAKNINLCKKSNDECAECIELRKLDIKSQTLILYNNCNFSCSLNGWTIKDEGRKKFVFGNFVLSKNKEISIVVGNKTDSDSVLYWQGEDYIWTSTGDALFLRDEKGELVLWQEINR